jgi:hypothetical protein
MTSLTRIFFLLMVFAGTAAYGQSQSRDAYMVPPRVYIGDRASLVLPLPGFTGKGDAEIPSAQIPFSQNIDIHRVAFERRPGGSRLVVEFSAYTPGVLELPPLEIAGEIFGGLKIEISSILDSGISGTILSGPALPLAVPGTSLLVYGTIGIVLSSLLLVLWLLFGEHNQVNALLAALRRRQLLVSMIRIEKRLRKALIRGAPRRETLDMLSGEFRSFLAWLTGENCRAMTAAEIGSLGPSLSGYDTETKDSLRGDKAYYIVLGGIFNRCDNVRFNGCEINDDAALAIFDDVRRFLAGIAV